MDRLEVGLHKHVERKRWLLFITTLMWVSQGCHETDKASPQLCLINSDCPISDYCREGVCVLDQRDLGIPCLGEDCGCLNDQDCFIGQRCDELTLSCVNIGCRTNAQCLLGEECTRRLLTDVSADSDLDGIPDLEDNCPEVPNAGQKNTDGICGVIL